MVSLKFQWPILAFLFYLRLLFCFFLILLPTHGSSCRWKKRNEGSCCVRVLSCCFCADGGAALPVLGSSKGPFLHRLKVWTVEKLPPSCSGDACPHLPGLQRSRGGNKNAHSSPGGLIILQQQQHFTELTFLLALWDWIQVDSFVKPLTSPNSTSSTREFSTL